jgi:hypothetical protein
MAGASAACASAADQVAAVSIVGFLPIATEIDVRWHVGGQDKSGLVVLNVRFVARNPKRTSLQSASDWKP